MLLPIFRNRTYIRFNQLDSSLVDISESLETTNANLSKFKTISANVQFSNGKGTYTDSSIKSTSRIIATRTLTSAVGVFVAGAKAYDGYCDIYMNSSNTAGTESLYLMIDSR